VAQEHFQLIAHYIGRLIASIVHKDPNVSVSTIIEAIKGFTNYIVKYGKARRAKEHAIFLLWGDWQDAYDRVPKILQALTHYNPSTKWCAHTTGKEELYKSVMKPVLERVYWCFPQCVEAFKHCRLVISVDGTFLTGKYMGVLLIAISVDGRVPTYRESVVHATLCNKHMA
jgi:hypothetical protein